MTVFTFPQNIYPFDAQLTVVGATDTFVARPGTTQTSQRAGSHWTYRVDFRNMSDDQWDELEGFVTKINGREHRIRAPIWSRQRIRGGIKASAVGLSAGAVHGAEQRGTKPITDGWGIVPAAAKGNLFKVGDLIEIRYPDRRRQSDGMTPAGPGDPWSSTRLESRLHRITADVPWTPPFTLDLWPPITVAPGDNAQIVVMQPHETWIMTNNPSFTESFNRERKTSLVLATDLLTGLPQLVTDEPDIL